MQVSAKFFEVVTVIECTTIVLSTPHNTEAKECDIPYGEAGRLESFKLKVAIRIMEVRITSNENGRKTGNETQNSN